MGLPESISQGCKLPWLFMGDFNSILNMEDRIGGSPVTMPEIRDFQQCVTTCGLIELPSKGSRYTWSDKQGDWFNTMPDFVAMFKPEGISDHFPVKIEQIKNGKNPKKPFKYCNVWSSHLEFQTRVSQVWQTPIEGCMMFQVVKKLKMVKQSLKEFNKKFFKDIEAEAAKDREEILLAQLALQDNHLDQKLQEQERESYLKFRRSSYLAEVYLQQWSKDKEGRLQAEPEIIANIFIEFYQDILGRKGEQRTKAFNSFLKNGNLLSVDQQLRLVKEFTGKEVKKAMFSIDINKSPCLGGYGNNFFRKVWNIVWEEIVMTCINSTKFSVKVNGEGHGYFDRRRGLRQGDPISPLLSVLIMEYLSRTLKRMSDLPDFKFHPMCKRLKLTHMIFADDLMIFRLTSEVHEEIITMTGFVPETFPIRYLGLPLSSKKWSKMECQQLLDKITEKITNAYSRHLSYAERLQIINVILFSIYNFCGAVFILLQSVLKAVDKRYMDYLWGTSEEHKKIALVV
ncbi:uncharacterized protein [Nicotiana tomentosiformis]|uniref:uncharacterized protein n=1 Tax=Nicotiana tomentosiformis TaxID=4098 RepID=UPI00388C5EFE